MKSFTVSQRFLAVVSCISIVSVTALAKTDLAGKIEQLKENAENSKVNLKQYEDNYGTVVSNLAETEKALRAIDRQKKALAKQTSDTAKGKVGIEATKKQLDGLIVDEKQKLDAEMKQIEELKKALAQIEDNVGKRQANLANYEEKMQKIDVEFASWSERNQSIIELEQALEAKEAQARADNKRLAEKKAHYEAEISKWKKQVRVSEREYSNFAKLKD